MIHHVSLGVKNLAAAKGFYDKALAPLGIKCLAEGDSYLGYGAESPEFWVLPVTHPVKADPESGLHFCLQAGSRKAVNDFHAAALKSGGQDNGKPGIRKDYGENYYAAFVVDPDGYRIEAFTEKA
ncbi:MAG TPA: VOC family protein [Candidatus Binataceae bacterium]|nr:VOC family protein [Candidatus Binataceae bacterium]